MDGPFEAMRCEACSKRPKTGSAKVGSDMAACHFSAAAGQDRRAEPGAVLHYFQKVSAGLDGVWA